MSRKLEALNWFNNNLDFFLNKTTDTNCQLTLSREQAIEFVKEFNILKQNLTELKAIKEANPSEALDELNEIIEYITEDKKVKYKATILFDCEIIKDALLKAEIDKKKAKAFDILKVKRIDKIGLRAYKNVTDYNVNIKRLVGYYDELIQEEFELLKEMLNSV